MDPNENIKRQWHVTVQDARVVEITYEVEAEDEDAANDVVYESNRGVEVARRIVSSNWEVINTEDVTPETLNNAAKD